MSLLLSPLAAIYGRAAAARSAAYQHGWIKARHLSRPVISVGNLMAGGTGKTPLVALIAKLSLKRGFKPAILTRGYRRSRGPSLVAIEPASARSPDARLVGDEPALLAAQLPEVPIMVSADRWRAGRFAEERFHVEVHILDDGFQHLRLQRDIDIVALDVTQELSDDSILPAGRQREPCAALKRAHLIVLTRVGHADHAPLEQRVREINPQATIFHSQIRLSGWVEFASRRRLPGDFLAGQRVYAFCGIGNPKAFFHDLADWGLNVCGIQVFRDHHVYRRSEINQLIASAQATNAMLVTTEKDLMNLPKGRKPSVEIFASLIEAEIIKSDAFEQALFRRLC